MSLDQVFTVFLVSSAICIASFLAVTVFHGCLVVVKSSILWRETGYDDFGSIEFMAWSNASITKDPACRKKYDDLLRKYERFRPFKRLNKGLTYHPPKEELELGEYQ